VAYLERIQKLKYYQWKTGL